MNLPDPLRQTLMKVAELCAPAADAWWVISSAAVALRGAAVDEVRDVDVLMSCRDAADALERAGSRHQPGQGTDLFRSKVFGIWSEPPLPVDIFGGFEFASDNSWICVAPISRERVLISGRALFIPDMTELHAMLIGFGRPKDLARARLL